MDATSAAAMAAVLGSLVGASASVATTLITQRTQAKRENEEWKLRERVSLYKDFVEEASRLAVDALTNSLDRPEQLVTLYGILSRIRLIAGDEVLAKGEECCHRIVELYRCPTMTADQIHAALAARELDPLKEFSAVCRTELLAMSSVH